MGLFDGLFGPFAGGRSALNQDENLRLQEFNNLSPEEQARQFRANAAAQRTPVPWQGGPFQVPYYAPVWQVGPPVKDARAERQAARRAARRSIGRKGR